jgi:hypothetical protein
MMMMNVTGEVEGGLAVLTGEPSFFSIRAKHFSRIGLLSKTTVYSIMRERPSVVLHIANTVVRRLSPFVRQVDFALDWVSTTPHFNSLMLRVHYCAKIRVENFMFH